MADIELDERKVKILNAIIKNYLETGEPVGSRTISKYTDLNLSSATIRNEMSDLEDLGYIVQPHTSAGRIPSDKGYRFYVNNLIAEKDKEVADMQEWMIEKTEKMESLLKNVAKTLANNTQYATLVSAPSVVSNRLKFVQLSAVDEHQVLSVVVMDGNIVKNKIINVDKPLDNETMLKLNMLLNTNLNGLTVDQINLAVISRLKEQAGIHDEIVEQVLDTVAETITEGDDLQVYTSGATNIFKYPELADSKKASELLDTFEEKQSLIELLNDSSSENESTGIQVYIGDESPISTMKDCSIVTATYELGDGVKGTIGIVGPKRMDYENVVDNIKSLKGQLDKLLKQEADRNKG
ncbi:MULTISPECIES: heat-inducible transcriptional repressor HrcA [Pseudobutyrivibrio]|uniref:Heat-inducible transcription repressor HrcA n=2 Tax=Pseudobutyrivibrio ruminis TaxID=46206 RepID=A0A1H7I987_9FIRM|nr:MULTISPECIES: heat-inducible transcriptional repressor HrcA [Pseudobutyrivibrio]SEK58904.1 heat-inducible transcription repressor HrcA [Pseudobutyrivibrio ruminis]SES74876.1 heat-inducible transcription repressor HrcA [Pseudobutyrivibrio sp. C4]SFO30044.1 heat-inducible transcription repressor HrcA [Pseudobutyrivibrio sp. JW11]SOC13034.1 heat-inducible transcription repressor HrcA [Pseudobutyrivibrio ruminis DSM 9787]